MRAFTLTLILSSVLGLVSLSATSTAFAQDKSPLKMTMLNVSEGGGAKSHKKIKNVLLDNDNVRYVDEDRLSGRLDRYSVSLKLLRKTELRDRFQKRLGRMIKKEGLEGLFLVDVYNRGRKFQLVVLGPDGEELANITRKIRGGVISNSQSFKVLNTAFRALGPKVLASRNRAAAEEESKKVQKPKKSTDGNVADKTELPAKKGDLERGLELGVGVFVGRRAMEVKEGDGPNDFKLEHGSPFVGAGLRLDAIAASFSDGKAALGITAFGAYAQFSTIFFDQDTNERQELSSAFTRVGAELRYMNALTAKFILDLYGGAELLSLTIAPNSFYTGNRYISGRAGIGANFRFGDDALLRGHAGVVPVFSADNSGGAFGKSPTSIGYEAGARLNFNISDSFFVQLNYTFQLLQPEYPEPSAPIDVPTESTDVMHTGNVLFGLSL